MYHKLCEFRELRAREEQSLRGAPLLLAHRAFTGHRNCRTVVRS